MIMQKKKELHIVAYFIIRWSRMHHIPNTHIYAFSKDETVRYLFSILYTLLLIFIFINITLDTIWEFPQFETESTGLF